MRQKLQDMLHLLYKQNNDENNQKKVHINSNKLLRKSEI